VSRLRRVLDNPEEVTFFLFLGAFALVIGVIYWFVSYELAGTILLVGFGIATGAMGVRLALDPRSARVRRRARTEPRVASSDVAPGARPRADDAGSGPGQGVDRGGRGIAGEGPGRVDRPFLDESGRLPAESLAPFAVGLGVAAAATGLIFGLAPVLVGLLPLGWGAWTWLHGAGDELVATESAERRVLRQGARVRTADDASAANVATAVEPARTPAQRDG
jgi:hypothetical protein